MLTNLISNPEAKQIFKALGNKARFVGGCVRDSLLNKPLTDIDIATSHLPEKTMSLLQASSIKVVPTGLKHGTVTAVINGKNFEITTLRRDVACDGRHAEVEFTDDWEQDAARRDFTINAMSADIDGKIYDYFDGQSNLERGVVRFVGDANERCREDILRILRFFRFYAYYGIGELDGEAIAACIKFAPQIDTLSGERIQAEMLKLIAAPNPLKSLIKMDEISILKHLLPTNISITVLEKLIAIENELSIEANPLLRLAALINNGIIDNDDLGDVLERWKLSNKHMRYLESVIVTPFDISSDMPLSEQNKIIRVVGRDIFIDIILLNWAEDISLSDDDETEYYRAAITNANDWEIPVFPVNGDDLKKLGIEEGRTLGKAIKLGEEWWEASGYKASKEDILTYIKQMHLTL
ncbi:MAG: cca [Rickettsiaceae bacterium]|nr:cca [Rickettsiaceae bacterium]